MFNKTLTATAAAMLMTASAATASTYVLDFDADPNNAAEVSSLDSSASQLISSPRDFVDGGLTWRVTSAGGAGVALFDTTCGYGFGANGCAGDADLQVFDQSNADGVSGNVLIQQEIGNAGSPDDDAHTMSLSLQLLSNVTLEWTGASALDDGFYRFNFGNVELGTVDNGNGRAFDNTTGSVDFAATVELVQNDVITVFFNTSPNTDGGASGAVDNFRFNVIDDPDGATGVAPVPLPASLPLLLIGAAAFAALRRRKVAA